MKHFPFIASVLYSVMLSLLLGIPALIGGVLGGVIYTVFFYPPIALRFNLVLLHPIVYTTVLLGVHLYTVFLACPHALDRIRPGIRSNRRHG